MNKHTPGPWKSALSFEENKAPQWTVFTTQKLGKGFNGCDIAYTGTDEQAQANARLIASAAELLEALQLVWSIVDSMRKPGINLYVDPTTIQKAQSAIAKAIGK
jgi:hypothetical protein